MKRTEQRLLCVRNVYVITETMITTNVALVRSLANHRLSAEHSQKILACLCGRAVC